MGGLIKLSSSATHEFWELPVLFEDEHLLALDKPAGLLTSSEPSDPDRPSLLELLHAGIAAGKPWATQRNLLYLRNAQRLDAPASGIILFAKSKPALTVLLDIFNTEGFSREYLVLVHGAPPNESGEVNSKLAPDRLRPGLTRVDPKRGKRSLTRFTLVERFARHSLLRCAPYPDRSHQVRVHLRTLGVPVVGDEAYRGHPLLLSRLKPDYHLKPGQVENPLLRRAALHCETLAFPHPVSREPLRISAPLPRDMAVGLKYLRRFSAATL